MSDPYLLLVFTTSHAIGIQKKLEKEGIHATLSTIPRGVSSDCGMCVRFDGTDLEKVQEIVDHIPFEIQEIIPFPKQSS